MLASHSSESLAVVKSNRARNLMKATLVLLARGIWKVVLVAMVVSVPASGAMYCWYHIAAHTIRNSGATLGLAIFLTYMAIILCIPQIRVGMLKCLVSFFTALKKVFNQAVAGIKKGITGFVLSRVKSIKELADTYEESN